MKWVTCFFMVTVAAFVGLVVPATAGPFGINAHTANTRLMDEADELGVSWIRIDFVWLFVETEQDVFDWSLYDRLISDAEERGQQVFATIGGTPLWATDGTEARGQPRSRDDWWDFCYRAAARYRGRVTAWGMWNEPNLDRFWEGSQIEYIEGILLNGADAIRSADSAALVAGPDLAHLSSGSWDDWLRSCLRYASAKLDVVAHHVYPSGTRAGSVIEKLNDDGYPWDPPSVRTVLNDSGWTNRPVWLAETGLESDEAGQDAQSNFYRDLLNSLFPGLGVKGWVDRVFFYELADGHADSGLTWGVLGPLPDHLRKQAFVVYQAFIDQAEIVDGAVEAVYTEGLYFPDQQGKLSVVVRNDGTVPWSVDDGLSIGIDGLPDSWSVEGLSIAPLDPVEPGETFDVVLSLLPPDRNPSWPNRMYDLVVRLQLPDGTGFGLPARTTVVTGTQPAPVFTAQPESTEAREGFQATFSVEVEADGSVTYEWQHNGLDIVDGASFSGAGTPNLTVHGMTRHLTGEYRCGVYSPDTHQVFSAVASLELIPEDDGAPREGDGRAGSPLPRDIRFDDVFPAEASQSEVMNPLRRR